MQITDKCCGCVACYSICPNNAIKIIQNKEGFYTPKIDVKKCIKCNKCKLICPQNGNENLKNSKKEYCYAVCANEDECKNSSSGGIFPLLANYILENGGYVCGASFNDDFKKVEHIIINDKKDLYKLRFSKYVQSSIKNTFKEVKELLEKGKIVLFSATPCQIAGLKTYLSKDYDNLYTIDLLCHGVPSPSLWEKYLENISKNKKVTCVNFRDKKYGWKPTISIKFDDNSEIVENAKENLYYKAFLKNLTLNDVCYVCQYRNLKRTGDITLGDFWGIEKIDPNFKNNNGVSLLILNTIKGKELFKKINPTSTKYKIKDEIINNINAIIPKHPNRKKFFNKLNSVPIMENLKSSLSYKYRWDYCKFLVEQQ